MIKNERQYKITKAKLEDLATYLASIDRDDPNLHPRQILGRVNSLEKTIRDLQTEIDEYDRLKNGEVDEIEVTTLAELPEALIKARIANNLTQKQLAERIGIQEQQVQRYEASGYETISFDRFIAIAQILGIDFRRSTSLAVQSRTTVDSATRGTLEECWELPVYDRKHHDSSALSSDCQTRSISENITTLGASRSRSVGFAELIPLDDFGGFNK